MDMKTIYATLDSSNAWSLFTKKVYGFLLVCASFVQSFTFTLHCLQPTAIFSLLERSNQLNVIFVLTLLIE